MLTNLYRFFGSSFVFSIISLTLLMSSVSRAVTEQECLKDSACASKIGDQLQSFLTGQGEGFRGASVASTKILKSMSKVYLLVLGSTKPFVSNAVEFQKLKDKAEMHIKRGVLLPQLTTLVADYVNDDLAHQCDLNSKTGNFECLSFEKKVSCAAFATHQGSRLWTARHCINTWLKDFDASSGTEPKAFVYSSQGELVAGPFDVNKLRISMPFHFNEGLYSMKDDFFEITLNKPVSQFFEILPKSKSASAIISVGFPASTGISINSDDITFRMRRDQLNAVEGQLMYSQGIILDPLAAQMAFTRSVTYAPYVDALQDSQLRVSSADAVPGMSGGPMIDSLTGNVIGIVTGGLWTVILDQPLSASVAVRPPGW